MAGYDQRQLSLEMRLLTNVVITDRGCWEWPMRYGNGYGRIAIKSRPVLAHRVSYATFVGPIPDGLLVCHKCDNRCCIYPLHLFLGTHYDNHMDKIRKGRHKRPFSNTAKSLDMCSHT